MKPLKAGSHCSRILGYLSHGRSITTLKAVERFRCLRLSERIRELEKRGHSFNRRTVSRNGSRYVEYRLVH